MHIGTLVAHFQHAQRKTMGKVHFAHKGSTLRKQPAVLATFIASCFVNSYILSFLIVLGGIQTGEERTGKQQECRNLMLIPTDVVL